MIRIYLFAKTDLSPFVFHVDLSPLQAEGHLISNRRIKINIIGRNQCILLSLELPLEQTKFTYFDLFSPKVPFLPLQLFRKVVLFVFTVIGEMTERPKVADC